MRRKTKKCLGEGYNIWNEKYQVLYLIGFVIICLLVSRSMMVFFVQKCDKVF